MKTFKQIREKGRCWPGHRPVPGKKPYSPGSCTKEDHVKELEDGLKKLDSHDYDTIDGLMTKISKKHGITGKDLHNDFKSKHGKTPDDWINEDLRKWFKQDWVRMDTKGNVKGHCAREPGEGKPKCLPRAKANALGKEGRAKASQRKRREDPNPERRGAPINVKTESAAAAIAAATAIAKKKSGDYDSKGLRKTPYKNPDHPLRKSNAERLKEGTKMKTFKSFMEKNETLDEKNVPTSPEKWARAKAAAKSKFAVYPSAYANGWASKKYKSMGGGWRSTKEEVEIYEKRDHEYSDPHMAVNQLKTIMHNAEELINLMGQNTDLPEWVESKITLAEDYIMTVANYMRSEMHEEYNPEVMFDIVEDYVVELAEKNEVDTEVIWEDFEAVPDEELYETAAWQRKAGKDPKGGLNRKGIASYRRENPGSKLSMAVTTKPSKLKKGSKAAKRRKSFCARMGGMKKRLTSAKTARDPNSRINKALRKWNC